ncbi:MAG: SdrD B-like domain-containing protein, partial [Flavobacteriales bacterium]
RALGLVYPYIGCDDDSACNYNPDAEVIDNDTCCFGTCGCSDEGATNYDPDATCGISDNCEYGISGAIYEDVNLNSQYDEGEPFLEGIVVEIESTGETATTNENGEYVFPSLDPGFYNLIVQTTEEFMFRSHSSPFSVNSVVEVEHLLGIATDAPSCCYYVPNGYVFEDTNEDGVQQIDETAISGVELIAQPGDVSVTSDENGWFEFPPLEIEQELAIYVQAPESHPFTTSGFPYVLSQNNTQDIEVGLSADLPELAFCVTCLFEEMLLCSSGSEGTCYIENNSNVPISGVLDIHPSDIYSDFDPFAFDSIVDGHYFMSFDEILPGETGLVDGDSYSYTTPSVQYIGDPLFLNHEVTVYHNDEYFGQGNYDFNSFVTCAYDPNDIQVEPRGYDEEHYVLPETDLVYRIRFQNTGNAPAQNILVQDTIPEELDLSSLQLLEYSHDIE